jgi:ammonium transporter, Amt family
MIRRLRSLTAASALLFLSGAAGLLIQPTIIHAEDATQQGQPVGETPGIAGDAAAPAEKPAPSTDAAAPAPTVDTGDTAWILTSAALVLFMTPGLAFFYGGLVRKKNMLSVLMQCFTLMAVITVQWVLFGYSLSFGPTINGWIGSLKWAGLCGVGLEPNPDYAATIPHQAFSVYQCMFAIITPGLILGAFAERMRFSAFVIFSVLWATLVYNPICHWVWAVGGMIRTMGALDFAGGTVVHINAGIAALAAALVLGKRKGFPTRMSPPHNLPFAVLGAGILWFGWFGFNAGSALGSGALSTTAFVATHVAAAAATLGWAVLDLIYNKHATVLGAITGAVAGLVAITPAAGFVTPLGALGIGFSSALICYLSVTFMKPRFGYDDTLDAVGVHGVGGIWGALATGLWATKAVNSAGSDGLFYGNPGLLLIQLKAVLITLGYSLIVSVVLLKVVDLMFGLRPTEDDERIGLDLSEHREAAYTLID